MGTRGFIRIRNKYLLRRKVEKSIEIKELNPERKKASVILQVSIDMSTGLLKDVKKMEHDIEKYKVIKRQELKFQAKNK